MIDIKWIVKNQPRRIARRILRRGETYWAEASVVRLLQNMGGELFIDVGSNKGFYSKLMKKRFRRVISIEPDPQFTYNHPMRVCLSNHNGTAKVFRNKFNNFMTLREPGDFHVEGAELETFEVGTVKVMKYDDLGQKADLVKLDVEGAEFDVLEGMEKFLPVNLIVELHDERREAELMAVLRNKGYVITRLDRIHFHGILGLKTWTLNDSDQKAQESYSALA